MSEYKAGIEQLKQCMQGQLKGTQFEQHNSNLEELLERFLNVTNEHSQEKLLNSGSLSAERMTLTPSSAFLPSFTRIVKHIRGGGKASPSPLK